jgi:predicted ABC-type ATPase
MPDLSEKAFEGAIEKTLLARMRELAHRRSTFAFETTLAGRGYARWIEELIDIGYRFQIIFFWLPDAESAVARVANRVQLGGHDVPKELRRIREFMEHYGWDGAGNLLDRFRRPGP